MNTPHQHWSGLTSSESRKALLVALFSTLLLSLLMIGVASWQLSNSWQSREQTEIDGLAHSTALIAEQFVTKAIDTAQQISSRTRARKETESFNRGEIKWEQVNQFITHKLQDALDHSTIAVAIVRVNPEGTILSSVGQKIPAHYIHFVEKRPPLIQRYVDPNGKQYLVVATSIINRSGQAVGTDIVLFTVDSLLKRLAQSEMVQHMPPDQLLLQQGQGTSSAPLLLDLLPQGKKDGLYDEPYVVHKPLYTTSLNLMLSIDKGRLKDHIKENYHTEQNYLYLIALIILAVLLPSLYSALRENDRHHIELEENAVQLRIAQQKALSASRAKSEFLTVINHEIRTPMNAIVGMGTLLTHTPLNEQQHNYIEVQKQAADSLLEMINDMLDLSAIEAGEVTLTPSTIYLKDLLKEVAGLLKPQAEEKQLRFTTHISKDTPETLQGDERRIRQILVNLTDNAIKFTAEGRVHIELYPHPKRPGQLCFDIEDSGIGITPEQQPEIFELFTQADSSATRAYEGSGIGLTISSRLSRLMGGEITLQSTPNSGSTFTLTLPTTLPDKHA